MSEPMAGALERRQLHELVRQANRLTSSQLPAGEFQDLTRHKDAVLEREDRPVIHLYAAAGVVARDLDLFLKTHPNEPRDFFATVIAPTIEEDQLRFPNTTMFGKEPPQPIPEGFAQSAALGELTLAGLDDPGIIHEWTSKPGKRIYKKFGEKFRDTICGADGPYEQLEGKIGPVVAPGLIVQSVITSGLSVATFLIPLLVLFAVILVKTGLKTFCEA